ncbi:MAG: Fumarate reductase iron-sulfur subunit [Candidatus Heimdallarchaeota archaeon LC_2]|nr:MAG: Fumarate reductase iron-sulfur subunit [Candidatus Heimdallarchaeota archaeon LC_2]
MSQQNEQTTNLKVVVELGDPKTGSRFEEYDVVVDPSMVVLDVIHKIQATDNLELAVRWNCKAGKCGSCGAEVNGNPKLLCMSKLSDYDLTKPMMVQPMKSFPLIKDLVTDVSWNYEVNKRIKPYAHPEGLINPRMDQVDVDRVQEFRKCIECFLCQDVCHVLRSHSRHDTFAGPRFLVRLAGLEMHPLDTADRLPEIKNEFNVGYCNITKCCTEVCPESIPITDEAIIALKERVADRYYDPLRMVGRFFKRLF